MATPVLTGAINQGVHVGTNTGIVSSSTNFSAQSWPRPTSNVPFSRDPNFINRNELDQLWSRRHDSASRVALVGLGGVGKTQVAIEYAYRIRDERPDIWVFWVHVSSTARVEEGFRMIAERIQAPCLNEANANILDVVSHWLGTHGPWVLILDNADDMDVLCRPWRSQYDQAGPNTRSLLDYLPSAANGSVLITSRSHEVAFQLSGTAEHIIEVGPMDPDTARVLLRKKLTVPASVEDANALVLILNGLPLTIIQATAFINQRYPRVTVSRYLEELQHGDREYTQLLQRDVGDQRRDGHASNSLLMTWRISFEHIRRIQPSAARLLAFMSCFDSQAIPEGLLHGYQDEVKSDDFDFVADVNMLRGYSLIRVQAQDKLEMHRLVQMATRKWLELNDELEGWQEKYVRTMEDAFPDGRYKNWPQCQILFPHVETMLRYRIKHSSSLELWAMVLFRASCYADEQGWFSKAEEMAQASLQARKVISGEDHPDALSSMMNLASVYRNKGRWAKAEALEVRALEKRRRILGEEHPDTLTSMANLASTYRSQGRLLEAEALEVRALEKRRRILGEEHPDTLTSMANLASTYGLRGQWAEAETLSETVLQTSMRVLGKEHPTTLTSLADLASIFNRQGQYKRAELLHSEALATMQRVLDKEHPSTLATMNDLADVLSNQGMYQQAEMMYRRALAVMERVLGTEHPSTLASMNNLARVLSNQGMYQSAETINRRVSSVMERVLGTEHPSILVSMKNLADVLIRQDKYVEAKVILRRTLMLMEEVLGKEHPFTLVTTMSLGDVLRAQDEYIEAENLLLFALTQPVQTSNVHSLDIQRGLDSLTYVLSHSSKSQIDAINEDEQSNSCYILLQTAALRGTWGLVQQLAEKRVKIDFSKVECRKALQTAADNGHHSVVHLLLLCGAETVSEDALHSALQAASASGHEAVVRLLLDKGANANLKLENHSSALQAASAGGHEAVVRLLLDREADANVTQEHYGSALRAASASGHEAVVQLLLDRQVDANAQVEHYGNALQAASAGGHQGLVRLLTDKSVLFSSYYDSGIFRDEGDNASSANSNRSFPASSATSFENEPPEYIFTILTLEVLLDPDVKDMCERILALRGNSLFMRIFRRNIREFCSTLSQETPTDIQRDSIWILRRFKAYFAFRVCQLLKPSTTMEGKQIEDLVDQTVEAGVERYLQDLHRAVQPQRDTALEGSTGELSVGETASSDYRNAEDHARDSEYWDNQSSESDSSDDEPGIIPQSLTNDTISWLTRGIAFLNFKHNLTKHISSPLQYVHQVVQPILSASKMCSVTFHVQWELIQYTKSELDEGDTIVHVLTVTGGIINAEATSCLDYCRRIWPETGEFVVMSVEKAIRTGWHKESSSLGTTISCRLCPRDASNPEERATIIVDGSREDVIGIAQQLAWLSTAIRVPREGKFACSEFVIHETKDSRVFTLKLLQLQDIGATSQACWHPIFLNGVLAHGFPIRPRDGESGVEIPFEAMIYFAGIIGPMEYRGGIVLKGFSTIIFPKLLPPQTANTEPKSVQWHLVYDQKPAPISLTLLADEHSRALWPLTELEILAQGRTFLGCYKEVGIHLGTKDTAYDRVGFSKANSPSRKPVFSGFTLGITIPKFGGPSAAVQFTKPKRQSLTREERSYEDILSYGSSMPLILYDTSDRRAWMVPALGAILHMIHIWASLQKHNFPTMRIPDLPYANAAWDISREAQEVIYKNSSLPLYISKDNNEPYTLKDLVKKYWIELEQAIVAEKDHESSTNQLTGWDLIELVTRDPFSTAKTPATREFKGNWNGLASDPNMVVLLCSGLGEVIVPNTDAQKLCNIWKSVPTEQDYLTASNKCIIQLSKRFPR